MKNFIDIMEYHYHCYVFTGFCIMTIQSLPTGFPIMSIQTLLQLIPHNDYFTVTVTIMIM